MPWTDPRLQGAENENSFVPIPFFYFNSTQVIICIETKYFDAKKVKIELKILLFNSWSHAILNRKKNWKRKTLLSESWKKKQQTE